MGRGYISHYKCLDQNVMLMHAVMVDKDMWRMRSSPGSGPQGTPFHHLSKQAWRAQITKTILTLLPTKMHNWVYAGLHISV